ncbi:unnamed protein product, partial [Allacma fusca]
SLCCKVVYEVKKSIFWVSVYFANKNQHAAGIIYFLVLDP